MNCQKCGNEINENQKFCTNCGAEINRVEEKQQNSLEQPSEKQVNNFKKKLILIILAIVFVICIIGIFAFTLPRADITTIVPIEQTEIKNMTERQALDLLVQQETDLDKYISKHPNANIDKLFETFYRNVLLFTGKKSDMDSKLSFDIYDYPENEQKSFIVKNITVNYVNENTYKITSPQTDIIRIVPIEEGIWGAEINDEYMIKKYSKNLSKEWKEYLKIFSDNNWWLDSFYDEIKFLSIYPNFCLQDIINSDLKNYMSRFSEYTNYYCNSEEDKALYQKFLSIKDNNIQEYKNIKQWYASLSEIQNQENEDKYDNVNFSREQMKIGYQFADEIKSIVKNKNINTFAELLKYPLTINKNDKNITISSKQQLINYGAEEIFTKDFIKNVCENDLFVNYQGFMLGNGEIWFTFFDNEKKPQIHHINIIDYNVQ